ncbi:MAG: histidine phosphatase family protein [Bacillota bacterium]
MGRIHLIRHGTTEANKDRKYYGSTDLPLANEGVDLITELAISGIYPKADDAMLYTTGLIRTEQTFFLIYGCKEHQTVPELQEYRFGEFEMKTHDELEDCPEYQAWISDKEGMTPCPGGESSMDFRKRIGAGFSKILENQNRDENRDKNTIIVCHGGVISLIMGTCFPEAGRNIFQWQPEPGRGYSIHIVDGEPVSYNEI